MTSSIRRDTRGNIIIPRGITAHARLMMEAVWDGKGCLIWTGNKERRSGYGHIRWRGKYVYTHRLAYELWCGDIPPGLNVLHHCDEPSCIAPTCLFLGTHGDNMRDKVAKGRQSRGERAIVSAKLTSEQVIAIRSDCRLQAEIATEYGVDQTNISCIKLRKTWRHL